MNGFRKSKGIVIELTALLDVILIMLFWIILVTKDNNEQIQAQADSAVEQAQTQLEQERENAQEQLERLAAEADLREQELLQELESIDTSASKNQLALDGYEQGILVTLTIRYENEAMLYISDSTGEAAKSAVSGDISNVLAGAFEDMGFESDDVVLCAFVYDGDAVLYRDVLTVASAVSEVNEIYENLYCTQINMTR